jgi:hypothetical protein
VKRAAREIEVLAAVFHGGLLCGHAFAAIFNVRQRKPFWTAFHVVAIALEGRAVVSHVNDVMDGRV